MTWSVTLGSLLYQRLVQLMMSCQLQLLLCSGDLGINCSHEAAPAHCSWQNVILGHVANAVFVCLFVSTQTAIRVPFHYCEPVSVDILPLNVTQPSVELTHFKRDFQVLQDKTYTHTYARAHTHTHKHYEQNFLITFINDSFV